MNIKQQFDKISKQYDQQRHQLLPCFEDYYHIPLTVMNSKKESPKILDVGSGTGLFTSIVFEKYPQAEFTLIDLSDKMLKVAEERFSNFTNFKYINADYTTYEFEEKFDIVISALSIHHLTSEQKERLYEKCYNILNKEGIFINVDQVLSPHAEIEAMFSKLWREMVEDSGLPRKEIEKAYERTKLDNPSTLADQLSWLEKAGFSMADCLYKYYHFCVLYAKK